MSILDRLAIGRGGQRLPMVLQIEASECGLACIAMIAGFNGHFTDLADLRRLFGISLKGATMREIIRIADEIGFATRPLRLELDEIAELRTPCILHWDLNHFVVLESVGSNGIVVHDPSMGIRRLTLSEASRHFTGVALELLPTPEFKLAPARRGLRAFDLLGHVTGFRRSLSHLLGLALAIELFAMLSPLFLSWVVDDALVSGDGDLLATLVIGFALLLVLQTTVSAMRSWMLMGINASLKVQSRANLFTHLLNLPVAFFDARHLGDVMSRFGSATPICPCRILMLRLPRHGGLVGG